MDKPTNRKLQLRRASIRVLGGALAHVHAGTGATVVSFTCNGSNLQIEGCTDTMNCPPSKTDAKSGDVKCTC